MDYEKKYKEALERAKEIIECSKNSGSKEVRMVLSFFPELAEGEDEKICRKLIAFLKQCKAVYGDGFKQFDLNIDDAIAWLEKRTEQKPADLKIKAGNWYICGMEVMNENMVTAFHRGEIYYCPKDGYLDVRGVLFEVGCLNVFRLATEKEIPQSKQEWSKEDRETVDYLIDYLESELDSSHTKEDKEEFTKEIELLKSLRPQNTWKPNEEQLNALHWCVMNVGSTEHQVLQELLEQLEKLKD